MTTTTTPFHRTARTEYPGCPAFRFSCRRRLLAAALCTIALSTAATATLRSQSFFASLPDTTRQAADFNTMERAFLNWSQNVTLDSAWGWKWYRRWEWFTARRVYTDGSRPDPRIYWREAAAIAEQKEQATAVQAAGPTWIPAGPTTVPPGDDPLKTHGLGRVNCVTFHPTDANTMWIGVAQGGVWKTVNGGQSWRPLTDNLPILRISDIAVDPTDPDVLYISVGDYAYLGTALFTDQRKRHTHYGLGVYKTTDGGENWFPTGLSFAQSDFDGSLIRRVVVHPENPAQLIAAGTSGVWASGNAGETWRHVDDRFIWDIEQSPANPELLCASTGYSDRLGIGSAGIVRSTDFGETWTAAQAAIPSVEQVERVELSFSAANPDRVYAVASGIDQGFYAFYYSNDGGESWSVQATTPNILGRTTGREEHGDATGGQGSYDLALLADPDNPDRVYVGGINIWGSTDGGSTWDIVQYSSNAWGAGLHPDQHFLAYNHLNGHYVICNDGGIYTTDAVAIGSWDAALDNPDYQWPTTWQSLNNGLAITSFYHIGLGPSASGDLIAGAQDNSTYYRTENSWVNILGGDGMECLIDPANPDLLYGSFQFGAILRYNRRTGTPYAFLSYPILADGTDAGEWSTPFQLHPTNSNLLYAAFGNVWVRNDAQQAWLSISNFPAMPGYNFSSPATAFAIAPSDPNRMYTAKRPWHSLGLSGHIYTTDNGGETWKEITAGLPDTLFVTSLDVDSKDPNRVWISCAGFAEGQKIFRTTDAGNSWANVSGNLPNLPANVVLHDPTSLRHTLYAGMDVGVYYTNDEMEGWQPYVDGLPNAIVSDLAIDPAAGKLAASTFGRGIWETETLDRFQGVPPNSSGTEATAHLQSGGNGSFTLTLESWPEPQSVAVTAIDITGRTIFTEQLQLRGGTARKEYKRNLPYGLYFVVADNGKERRVVRFVADK